MGSPLFAAAVKTWQGSVSSANTNRDGTGTIVTIGTAGANGSVITSIILQSAGASGVATTAGMIRLFIEGGGTTKLWKEVPVQVVTPTASVPGWSAMLTAGNQLPPGGFRLQPGYLLRASTHIAEAFNIFADAGDF